MKRFSVVTAVAFLLSFTGRSAWGEVLYTVTDLGTPPGCLGSSALGINASGQVVGEVTTSVGYVHAFLYTNGTMVDLGMLTGSPNIVDTPIVLAAMISALAPWA